MIFARLVSARIIAADGRKVWVSHVQSGLGNRAISALILPEAHLSSAFIDEAARQAVEGHEPC